MRVPLLWLREFVELPIADPAELADVLNQLGHEVEGYELLEPDWSGVVVGKVVGIQAHPDADKVRVCQVDLGDGIEQIICGAWNFDVGAHVAVARPGAVLPGEFQIGIRDIRGVTSNGMICSERELGLGDDQAGILVLEGSPEPGIDFTEIVELPDVVFDLSITPNRGDAMSLLGIARDLAAHYGASHGVPERDLATIEGKTEIEIDIQDPERCWRFTAREIRGVQLAPSPLWMRHRLAKAGIRAISNVVDVTNYVMLELGHPLHAFDARSIVGSRLVIKRAEPGESLVTLDGVERRLTPEDLIIYDEAGPTSMAGTMGGERSEVSSATADVLMEAAMWDPPTIMYMSRRHDLRSEASTRFERGVDPALSDIANRRACSLIAELASGQVLNGAVDAVARPHVDTSLELPLATVARTLGAGLDGPTISDTLTRLGMEVSGDDPLSVVVPSYRVDVTRPIDLVEEVARIHGYEKFEPTLRLGSAGGLTPEQARLRLLHSTLARAGLNQAVTLPFVSEADLSALELDEEVAHLVRVKNPLRDEESRLRPTLLPGLLGSLRFNLSHGNEDLGLFESGTVFRAEPDDFDSRLPKQSHRVGLAAVGSIGYSVMGSETARADAYLAIALVRQLGAVLGTSLEIRQGTWPGYHPGRTALVMSGDRMIGTAGELHPATANHFDIRARVAVAELDVGALVAEPSLVESQAPSVFPFVDFDLSFVVPVDLPVGDVRGALTDAGGALLESCVVFDDFRDSSLDAGTHAVAFHCRLRAPDRTLSNEEMRPVREAMIEAAGTLGAKLRGA